MKTGLPCSPVNFNGKQSLHQDPTVEKIIRRFDHDLIEFGRTICIDERLLLSYRYAGLQHILIPSAFF